MLVYHSLLIYLSTISSTAAFSSKKTTEPPTPAPCTIRSPTSKAFYDLNPLHIQPLDPNHPDQKPLVKHGLIRDHSWNATGYDIGYNFTLNFCGGVVESLHDVKDISRSSYANISAFYRHNGDTYSLGMQNSRPVFRGRKLVLNYTGGSFCDDGEDASQAAVNNSAKGGYAVKQASTANSAAGDLGGKAMLYQYHGHDSVDARKEHEDKDKAGKRRRKNTIVSILCDKDPLSPHLTLSFVGASPDQCTYMFEARSNYGCPTVGTDKQSVSPSGVFGVIMFIAVVVYIVGGCVYSRVVLNQRGWRQVPNYNLWAGILSFVKDLFVILTASCTRWLPSRRGYSRVQQNGFANSSRGRDAEANRLIDDLNEEWED